MIVVVVGSGLDSFHSTESGLVVVCMNFWRFAYFRRGGGECSSFVWLLVSWLSGSADPLNPVLGRGEIAFDGVDGGSDGGTANASRGMHSDAIHYSGWCLAGEVIKGMAPLPPPKIGNKKTSPGTSSPPCISVVPEATHESMALEGRRVSSKSPSRVRDGVAGS